MVDIFPQIFVLGFLIVYVALLAALVWSGWHSRIRSGSVIRRLLSKLGVLRGSWFMVRKRDSEEDQGESRTGPHSRLTAEESRATGPWPGAPGSADRRQVLSRPPANGER
jgi:hypothetical protein